MCINRTMYLERLQREMHYFFKSRALVTHLHSNGHCLCKIPSPFHPLERGTETQQLRLLIHGFIWMDSLNSCKTLKKQSKLPCFFCWLESKDTSPNRWLKAAPFIFIETLEVVKNSVEMINYEWFPGKSQMFPIKNTLRGGTWRKGEMR